MTFPEFRLMLAMHTVFHQEGRDNEPGCSYQERSMVYRIPGNPEISLPGLLRAYWDERDEEVCEEEEEVCEEKEVEEEFDEGEGDEDREEDEEGDE